MKNPQEVYEWAANEFRGFPASAGKFLAEAVMGSSPPAWGDTDAWHLHSRRKELWLLAFARHWLWQASISEDDVSVSLHGRGIRLQWPAIKVDLFIDDFEQFTQVLGEEAIRCLKNM